MRLGGIYVDTRAKTDKLKRDLAKAETMSQRTAIKMKHQISKISFRAVGVAAMAFAGTFAYAMKKSIDAASDLEETASKFAVVFAGQVEEAERNAKVLRESYAMSREEAMRYLSSVQDLLVPMGMASKAAAGLSHEIVKLAADLGSFNNMPTERVMLDIQSALVGNFETMKKYGVVLNATVVAEKALAMGLADTKDALTAGERAQAAYALMVEGSEAAMGDMARTSGSYANQMKKLHANLKDLQAEIGKELLPEVTKIISEMNKWIKANDEILKSDIKIWISSIAETLTMAVTPLRIWADLWQRIGWVMSGAKEWPFDKGTKIPQPPKVPWSQIEAQTGGGPSITGMPPDEKASVLGIASPEEMDAELARLVEAEEMKFQIAMQSQTRMEEMLATSHGSMIEAERVANEARMMFYAEAAGQIAGTFLQIAQAGGKQSRLAFRMYQGFAITQAYMAAAAAYVKTLAEPGLPWPGNIAMAKIIAGMAATQIALIAAAKPPSYDLGGVSTTPGVYYAGVPEAHIPLPSGGKIPVELTGGQAAPTISINMTNPTFEDEETRRQVFAEIAEIIVNKTAPDAVYQNYMDDGIVREMVIGDV